MNIIPTKSNEVNKLKNAVLIDPTDNVVAAIEPITAGHNVVYLLDGKEVSFPALQDIPIYHKIAREDILAGEVVRKYGEYIALATQTIPKGSHAHLHNLSSKRMRVTDEWRNG